MDSRNDSQIQEVTPTTSYVAWHFVQCSTWNHVALSFTHFYLVLALIPFVTLRVFFSRGSSFKKC